MGSVQYLQKDHFTVWAKAPLERCLCQLTSSKDVSSSFEDKTTVLLTRNKFHEKDKSQQCVNLSLKMFRLL